MDGPTPIGMTVLNQVKILYFQLEPDKTNVQFLSHCILDGKHKLILPLETDYLQNIRKVGLALAIASSLFLF